jgi:site-specific DNA-methyltransferase (adenine-specific)
MRALIAAYSMPGDLVIDPFAGAGTVLRLARALGRRAVGYEIDPDAIAAINANLAESTSP